jgi:hypothetical protein
VVNEYWIVFFICPRDACKAQVVLNYKYTAQRTFGFKSVFIPDGSKINGSKIKCMYANEEIILNVSEKFVEINNQAQQAESYGLDLICGAGYRKALEY